MIQVAVIADDLTGANATGVQLTKKNLRAFTLMDSNGDVKHGEDCDVIIHQTDSRSITKEMAYMRVYESALRLKKPNIKLYSKRIDSTLRGNIGSEMDAMLDAIGDDALAIIVPSFPHAGRVVIGGRMLVHGVPLNLTEVATDPKNPVHTPVVADVFRQQSKYEIGTLYVEDVSKGVEWLCERIKILKGAGKRALIFDSTMDSEMEVIADAVRQTGYPFITVDPGVFTSVVCSRIIPTNVHPLADKNKVLAVVGSVNPVAAGQVQRFLQTQNSHHVFMEISEFLKDERSRYQEISRVVERVLEKADLFDTSMVVGSGIYPQNRIDLQEFAKKHGVDIDAASIIINDAIAEITGRILAAKLEFKGLYTSGGDISVHVCKRIRAAGLELVEEIVPLASYGVLKGGPMEGIRLITKGGMVGDENAIITCVNHLKGVINK
ncbi:MAG: hypothetical protein FWF59_13115 [Turicibacter sp.]|nr:hypothetical protein [Turicibacter sp.]